MRDTDKFAVLTGGGDVPGLNSVIKSVVYRSSEMGRSVLGIRRGWEGLTHFDPSQEIDSRYIRPLNRENTRAIDRSGGTVLHTSRTNPLRIKKDDLPKHMLQSELSKLSSDGKTFDFTPVVLRNLERLGIGCLFVIGGDDTLGYATTLHRKGFPVIAIPKTMDNDVRGTEYCVGFSTAITRAKDLVTRQRTTLGSHERIGVFRIFGRDAGFTALYTAYVTSARCLIPEYPFDLDLLIKLLVEDKRNNPSNYSLVIASEGAVWSGKQVEDYGEADAYGHRKKVDIGHALAEILRQRTGEETMMSDMTYDLRSGDPDAVDQVVATTFANLALDLVGGNVFGRMVAVREGRYAHAPLPDPALGPRIVDVAKLYNTKRYRPHYTGKLGDPLFLISA
ncbi:MAG TPA: 6-phosphofructokinase [Candidatus Acidoferrales bacterium]|nr:6-phosphofructokinase [Candidatus Acidoferrales bacterium]